MHPSCLGLTLLPDIRNVLGVPSSKVCSILQCIIVVQEWLFGKFHCTKTRAINLNANPTFTGCANLPLVERGVNEALKLVACSKPEDYHFDSAFTSTLDKVITTCELKC